jgi:hypothetical protein
MVVKIELARKLASMLISEFTRFVIAFFSSKLPPTFNLVNVRRHEDSIQVDEELLDEVLFFRFRAAMSCESCQSGEERFTGCFCALLQPRPRFSRTAVTQQIAVWSMDQLFDILNHIPPVRRLRQPNTDIAMSIVVGYIAPDVEKAQDADVEKAQDAPAKKKARATIWAHEPCEGEPCFVLSVDRAVKKARVVRYIATAGTTVHVYGSYPLYGIETMVDLDKLKIPHPVLFCFSRTQQVLTMHVEVGHFNEKGLFFGF